MDQIYPLHEDHIKNFCGMAVCAVTHDGQRHYGILSRCHGGKLMFNEQAGALKHVSSKAEPPQQGKVTNSKVKSKKGSKKAVTEAKPKEAAQTQAYYPYDPYYGDPYYGYGYGYGYSPFGGAFALDLAALAFLFLLI
ncbi:hypothetical protein [Paenibacillus lignilyticus]|uniref:Uncharacterized protein n=1 Tax=Paenibacillus lignilyticus TaxID=1172615 RepID=A0ABS5CJ94_9BACL|nr:hypothetical protein [Paenibacillus lignilyticus]MBP3965924.1 hypothetical protein [Paenibacillus lignilyticus]